MRERLIGAAIVLIAIVIIVPWLVSRSHRPSDVTENLPVPGAATVTSSRGLVVKSYPSVAAKALAKSHESVSGAQAATSIGGAVASISEKSKTVQGKSKNSAPTRPKVASNVKPILRQHPAVPKKPTESSTTKSASSGWIIQVASFNQRSSAVALVKRLSKLGYHAYIKPNRVRGQKFFQVRVGPISERTRLQSAESRLETIVHAKVLTFRTGV